MRCNRALTGLARAFVIGADSVRGGPSALILGGGKAACAPLKLGCARSLLLYFCDPQVVEIAASLKPSAPGELEIAISLERISSGASLTKAHGRGFAWFDMGTHDSLLAAPSFVQTLEKRQGLRIACPEEIAYNQGLVTNDQFFVLTKKYERSTYGQYLLRVASERE